ncbi:hypothetical protein JCM10207_004060 [Rhodosporidiobolus poonsookiae]
MTTEQDTKGYTVETPADAPAPAVTADTAPSSSVSPPASDQPTVDTASEAAPAQETETTPAPVDPKVAQLRALFPDVDVEIAEAVLASNGGNVDEAVETLLSMADPTLKPPNAEELSQLELDEELARQLAREDELAQTQYRVNAPHRSSSMPHQQQQQNQPLAYKPYVPKARRQTGGPASPSLDSWQPPANQPRSPQQQQEQPDELEQLTEQFSKFAEQGKKTFGNFWSKAKEQMAKVDEMVVRSASPTSSSGQAPAPPPKSDSPDSWRTPSALPRPADAPPRTTSASDSLPRPTPLTAGRAGGSPSPARSASPAASTEKSLPTVSSTSADTASPAPAPSAASPAASPSKPSFTGKIPGLLPRQSFSLLDQQSGGVKKDGPGSPAVKSPLSQPGAVVKEEEKSHYALGDDSEDDMEYVKNPFEED